MPQMHVELLNYPWKRFSFQNTVYGSLLLSENSYASFLLPKYPGFYFGLPGTKTLNLKYIGDWFATTDILGDIDTELFSLFRIRVDLGSILSSEVMANFTLVRSHAGLKYAKPLSGTLHGYHQSMLW
jgi:hypothetical protein